MLERIWLWILTNVFKIQSETSSKEIEENVKYANDYKDIARINYNSIFSNKLANYCITDSEIIIDGENARVEFLNKIGQSLWKKMKKYTAMSFGYGGIILVPYVKGGKLYYNVVPQDRLTIDKMDGELITCATVLADRIVLNSGIKEDIYLRWTNYKIENNSLTIKQSFTDANGKVIPVPSFWSNIVEEMIIRNVDRVPFGYIKSPINNRKANDKYGVPITYGCDSTIKEIEYTLAQIFREYDAKQVFVGVDSTMFGANDKLSSDGIFKKLDSGENGFFEVFDPQFRDTALFNRLQELYIRLEHEIGTSSGILSKVETQNATATEIKRAMYDTFTLVDDMRSNIEKGLEDFFYACDILSNTYSLAPNGTYEISYNWSYGLIEDSQEEFNQLMQGVSQGVISKEELRQWLKPTETLEDAQEKILEIKATNPSMEDLLGRNED